MEENVIKEKQIIREKCKCNCHATGGGIYFLAFVGALVYYLQNASGLYAIVWGIIKAIVWPAILVYQLLKLVHG